MARKPNARESAMLILQRGGEAGLTWPLERQTVTIGRGNDCDIVLDDRQVSRVHARIIWNDNHYELEDLGSKNGTHLNGSERSRCGMETRFRLHSAISWRS
jgi:pSer/pThr/pTyr-binding forkhead associated (FHA) protein